ncbi:MAG: MOSC domain-containing protein, partial [Cytophagales bacterium]
IGQSSLDDLNSRLQHHLPMNRFRPNLVFTGGQPYEEDNWRGFSIGKKRFVGVTPCARCVLTTIDQHTAMAGKEPLATLATYRKKENKIYFGQNVIALDYDEIFEGDEIIVE